MVVEGRIAEVDYFSRGVKYALDDGTGRIILLVWQNVMEELEGRYDLFPGSQVRVAGEIDEYQGDLEIIPDGDGTGELLVFVPQRSVEYLPVGIGAGVGLRVTGEVEIYQGQLEIIPLAGADVQVR